MCIEIERGREKEKKERERQVDIASEKDGWENSAPNTHGHIDQQGGHLGRTTFG